MNQAVGIGPRQELPPLTGYQRTLPPDEAPPPTPKHRQRPSPPTSPSSTTRGEPRQPPRRRWPRRASGPASAGELSPAGARTAPVLASRRTARGRRKPQPHHLRRERRDALGPAPRAALTKRPQGAGDAPLSRTAQPSPLPPGSSCRGGRVTRTPSPGGGVGDVGPAVGAHLAPLHPAHEEEPRNHGVAAAARAGDSWPDSTPRPPGWPCLRKAVG